MSINSLANAAAARRPETAPAGRTPQTLDEIAAAASTPPVQAQQGGEPSKPTPGKGNIETALNVLFGYIPTEIITLYVAVLAAVGVEGSVTRTEWLSFGLFLLCTPVVVWLVYGAKLKNADLPLPLHFAAWPVWEMFAASVAFGAWAFALPKSPFAAFDWYSSALSGLVVLITSAVLGLLAPFFQRRLKE
jgi:hypothetical protein